MELPNPQAEFESLRQRSLDLELLQLMSQEPKVSDFLDVMKDSIEFAGMDVLASGPEVLVQLENGQLITNKSGVKDLVGTYIGVIKLDATPFDFYSSTSEVTAAEFSGKVFHSLSFNLEKNGFSPAENFVETIALLPVDTAEIKIFDDFRSFDPRVLERSDQTTRQLYNDVGQIVFREDVLVSDRLFALGDRIRSDDEVTAGDPNLEIKRLTSFINMSGILEPETLLLPDYIYKEKRDGAIVRPSRGAGLQLADTHFTTGNEYSPPERATGNNVVLSAENRIVIAGRTRTEDKVFVPLNQHILVA